MYKLGLYKLSKNKRKKHYFEYIYIDHFDENNGYAWTFFDYKKDVDYSECNYEFQDQLKDSLVNATYCVSEVLKKRFA